MVKNTALFFFFVISLINVNFARATIITFTPDNVLMQGSFSYVETRPDPSVPYDEVRLMDHYGVNIQFLSNDVYFNLDSFGFPGVRLHSNALNWMCTGSEGCNTIIWGTASIAGPVSFLPNNGFEFERYDFSFAVGSHYGQYAVGYRYITRSLDGIHVTTEPNPREGDSPSGKIWEEELKLLRSNAVQSVPEPSTYAMMGLGLIALLGVTRRRQAIV